MPNVIFIMSDDQGYADLGCYGSSQLLTPNLDKLAAEGMKFTQVYAGSPVCAPARCVLMTGKHSGHATRKDNRSTNDLDKPFSDRKLIPLNDEDFTVAEMMQMAGYTTGGFGKWGLGNLGTTGSPDKQGFDEFFGYLDQMHAHNYYTDFLIHNTDTFNILQNADGNKEVYTHDIIHERAMQFVKENKDNPFFLYLPYTLPHGKYEVPDNSVYADKKWTEKVKNYAAMITWLDEDIGELMNMLKSLDLDDNTIVFFTSDNGPNPPFLNDLESNKPFRGVKRQLLEGGIRVPMIVRWPGKIQAGTINDMPWTFYDVMPTIADLINYPLSEYTDGISVANTLRGQHQKEHKFLYWEFYNPFQQAVRMGNLKGIRLGTEEEIHLFDLSNDLREEHNLTKELPDIVQEMEKIMNEESSPSPFWPLVKKANQNTEKQFFSEN